MRVIGWNVGKGSLGNQDRSTNAAVVKDAPEPPEVGTRFLHRCPDAATPLTLDLSQAIRDFYGDGDVYTWEVIALTAPGAPFLKEDTTFDDLYHGPDLIVTPGEDVGKIQIGAFVDGVATPVEDFFITVYPSPTCGITGSDSLCLGNVSEEYSSGAVSGDDPFPGDLDDQLVDISYDWQVIAGIASIINGVSDQSTVDVDSSSLECGDTFTLQLTVTKSYYLQPGGPDTQKQILATCSSTCTKEVTVEDTEIPVIASAPGPITVECLGDLVAAGNLAWTDNCDAGGNVLTRARFRQRIVLALPRNKMRPCQVC